MLRWITHILPPGYLVIALLCVQVKLWATPVKIDTNQIIKLNEQAQQALLTKQTFLALHRAQQALKLAEQDAYDRGSANSLFILGKVNQTLKKFASSLNFFLQAKTIYEKLQQSNDIAWVYYEIGNLYLQWQSPTKSLENYKKSQQELYNQQSNGALTRLLLEKIGDAHYQMNKPSKAVASYRQLLNLQQSTKLVKDRLNTLKKLAKIHKQNQKLSIALSYEQLILKTLPHKDNLSEQARTLHNIGFLYKQLKRPQEAVEAFVKALKLYQAQKPPKIYESICADLMTSIGITYNFLQEPQKSQNYLEKAIELRKKEPNPLETARLYNLLATNYCIQGNPDEAEKRLQQAIKIAQANQNKEVLQNSYKVYIKIHEQNRNNRQIKTYYKRLVKLKEEIEIENQQKLQALYAQQLAIEKKENDYRLLLAEEEKQASLNRQLQLESEKKEQTLALKASELTLLRREQELQQARLDNELLEKGKVKQLLSMAEQRLRSEEQRLLIDSLRTNKKIQQLAFAQQRARDKERKQRIALLEKDKKLRQQILHEERVLRRNTLIGMGIFLLLTLAFTYQIRKRNQKLKKQNQEIIKHQQDAQEIARELMKINKNLQVKEIKLEESNTKLEKQNYEIRAHNFILNDTIDELGRKNKHIQDSLHYAQRMQNAMLPFKAEMEEVFQEHFVIFKPKEIVSGDFYWLASVKPRKAPSTTVQPTPILFFAVVDCTGHGVPGGFLSMMGFALLNEIIHIEKVYSPAKILHRLDTEIRQSLKQANTRNNDGMDICLCKLEETNTQNHQLTFAGAKRPLFYTLPQVPNELIQIPASRSSIGGSKTRKIFEEETLDIPKGSTLYLSTDGMIHLPNKTRRNFGSRRFKQMLAKYAHLSLAEQQEAIVHHLRDFQNNETEQRDDITLVGIRT
ncbi:hypothetical protein BKI52_28600 [marine bacterium AO1-C]|nr:hypothetical protein BKI52_28600 [marine bacterium AO1-C]